MGYKQFTEQLFLNIFHNLEGKVHMPKSAVVNLSFENEAESAMLKRLSLLFDDIYVDDFSFKNAKFTLPLLDNVESNAIATEIEWLIDKGIVKTYKVDKSKLPLSPLDNSLLDDILETDKHIHENLIYNDEYLKTKDHDTTKISEGLQFVGALMMTRELKEKMDDIGTRIRSSYLSIKDDTKQFIPILNSFESYTTKKSPDAALHFILGKVPMPDVNTSWEELIDFRSDEDTRRKYYALIDWVNEMARSNMPLTHLADKYNYLYSEYIKQYSLHKMKSSFTNIELLIMGGIEFISLLVNHNYATAFKSLINIGKQNSSLLEQEQKLSGREVAYIHSVKNRF